MKFIYIPTLVFLAIWPLAAQDANQPKVNADAALVADFQKRVDEYVKVRKGVEQKLSSLKQTDSQATIQGHEAGLAAGIKEARHGAKQGDVFTPAIANEFRRLTAIAMQGGDAARVKSSLKNSEPVQLQLRVNDTYPKGVPLQSTPPTLLLNLPRLPEDMEYRVVGASLVLLCAKSNLVVDFVPNIMPPPV